MADGRTLEEELLERATNILRDSEEIKEMLALQSMKDKPFVEVFCQKYGVTLRDTSTTEERGFLELSYGFDDGLGYYTIDGVQKSLD